MFDALLILFLSLLYIFVISGLGNGFARMLRLPSADFPTTFWLGLAGLILLLGIWNFFLPVTVWVNAIILALGITGHTVFRPSRVRHNTWNNITFALLLASPFVFALLIQSMAKPMSDAGLYHFQAIRWSSEHPAVHGLGNLHFRLGFNQTIFLFVAFLNSGLESNIGHHLANLLLFSVVGFECSLVFVRWWRDRSRPDSVVLICALGGAVIAAVHPPGISSPSADAALFAIALAVSFRLANYLFPDTHLSDAESTTRSHLAVILVLSVLGMTLKLSFCFYGATLIAILLLREGAKRGNPLFQIWRTLSFCVALGLVWIARGYITTGYPAFPAQVGGISVDWKVPADMAHYSMITTKNWARLPSAEPTETPQFSTWFPKWWDQAGKKKTFFRSLLLLFGLSLVVGWIVLLTLLRRKPGLNLYHWGIPTIPLYLSILFWFLLAPDPRFAGSTIWCLVIWLSVFLWDSLRRKPKKIVFSTLMWISMGIFILLPFGTIFSIDKSSLTFPPIKSVEHRIFTTDSKLKLNVPAEGSLSWYAPLPATPHPNPDLELRGDDLRNGFRVNRAP